MNLKSIKYLFPLCAIMFVMISCDEEYDKTELVDNFESRLVINDYFSSDHPWSVSITSSGNILDENTNNDPVTYAKVEIFDQDDEKLFDLDHIADGVYGKEGFFPSATRGYGVKVSATGFRTVTARSTVPEKSTLTINDVIPIKEEKEEGFEVDFEIADNSNLDAYYLWEVIKLDPDEEDNTTSSGTNNFSTTLFDDLDDKSTNISSNSREIIGAGLFGDGTYNTSYNSLGRNRRFIPVNTDFETELETNTTTEEEKLDPNTDVIIYNVTGEINDNGNGIGGSGPIRSNKQYELRVMSISRELYEYYSSVEESLKYPKGSTLDKQFKLFSNVNNGLGIFAGYSESVIQF